MLMDTATQESSEILELQLHQTKTMIILDRTIPSVVGRDGYRTNDIIWQFIKHSIDGSITNTYSGNLI